MTATAYRFHSIEADGPWASPPFPPAERRHIVQGVIGGFIMGRPRWAEDLDGSFIYGLDAKGKELKSAPAYTPTPTPRRRGKSKPKTAVEIFRVEREIEDASGPTGKWKVTDTFGTRREAEGTADWVRRHGGRARVASLGRKTPAQLDAEIAEILAGRKL